MDLKSELTEVTSVSMAKPKSGQAEKNIFTKKKEIAGLNVVHLVFVKYWRFLLCHQIFIDMLIPNVCQTCTRP